MGVVGNIIGFAILFVWRANFGVLTSGLIDALI
jgi:hypothetical protein